MNRVRKKIKWLKENIFIKRIKNCLNLYKQPVHSISYRTCIVLASLPCTSCQYTKTFFTSNTIVFSFNRITLEVSTDQRHIVKTCTCQ